MYISRCSTLLVDTVCSYAVLLDSAVSPSLHVQWGSTPLLRAAEKGHAQVARFLLENGSSVTEQNKVGWLIRVLSSSDHSVVPVVLDPKFSHHLTIMHGVCLFVCPLYKSAPLRGSPRNMPCTLRDTWGVFLGDRHATTCSVAEERAKYL